MEVIVLAGVAGLLAGLLLTPLVARSRRTGRGLGTPEQLAGFATLHAATLAAPPLREGLHAAARSVGHLRQMLGTGGLALVDATTVLGYDGEGADHHSDDAVTLAASTLRTGRTTVVRTGCASGSCPLRSAAVAPLLVEGVVVGAVVAFDRHSAPVLLQAVTEVARWVSAQLELAGLDDSRARLAEAEVRALRAQISPHFIYNSLTAIASFTRTDPDRARELLLEFADFTRYSFRRHGEFTTLAEELRSIDRYLLLERARFGDRLSVTVRVAPEVLGVTVPFLCLQPLVENAVKHGLDGSGGTVRLVVVAADVGAEAVITVEDDGPGSDPEAVRRSLAGHPGTDSMGLGNVDERLRTAFGDDHGLLVETAPGAGTKVTLRIPKYRAGVSA